MFVIFAGFLMILSLKKIYFQTVFRDKSKKGMKSYLQQ